MASKWTTEQVEAYLAEVREMARWHGGSPEQHALAALADMADWLLGESRAQRQALRQHLDAAIAAGETNPDRLRYLTQLASRGPADEDDDLDLELELEASVAAAHGSRGEPAPL